MEKNVDVLRYYDAVIEKVRQLASASDSFILIAPEQFKYGVRSVMVGLYVPDTEHYKTYIFRSSMNDGELGDKYKAMVSTVDALGEDWDEVKKKRQRGF